MFVCAFINHFLNVANIEQLIQIGLFLGDGIIMYSISTTCCDKYSLLIIQTEEFWLPGKGYLKLVDYFSCRCFEVHFENTVDFREDDGVVDTRLSFLEMELYANFVENWEIFDHNFSVKFKSVSGSLRSFDYLSLF